MPIPSQPVPIRIYRDADAITADWVDLAGTDPSLPFLSDRIAAAGASWRAPLPVAGGAAPPAALILHAGRCGSTLVSRALSRLARCHVLSEPQAVNDILGVDGTWPFLPTVERADALRRVGDALVRSAQPHQDRVILKLSSWNALHLPLLDTVFPHIPKLFLYRQPEEILVSLRDSPAGWMGRGEQQIAARLFLASAPMRTSVIETDRPLKFAAQVVGGILTAVADGVARCGPKGEWLLMSYASLPSALTDTILPWLELVPTATEAKALAQTVGIDAKDPTGRRPFEPDGARKRAAVTGEVAELARTLASAPYQRLEALRQAGVAV